MNKLNLNLTTANQNMMQDLITLWMKDNVYTNVEKKNYMMEGTGVIQFSKALKTVTVD